MSIKNKSPLFFALFETLSFGGFQWGGSQVQTNSNFILALAL